MSSKFSPRLKIFIGTYSLEYVVHFLLDKFQWNSPLCEWIYIDDDDLDKT